MQQSKLGIEGITNKTKKKALSKRIGSSLIALLLVLGALPVSATAAFADDSSTTLGDITWSHLTDTTFQTVKSRPVLAVSPSGKVAIAGQDENSVSLYSSDGSFIKSVGTAGYGNGQLMAIDSLAFDKSENLYVASTEPIAQNLPIITYQGRVQIFDKDGNWVSGFGKQYDFNYDVPYDNAGNGPLPNKGDGLISTAYGLAIAPNGDIYVSQSYGYRVQVFNSTGTFKFAFGEYGNGDGQFSQQSGIGEATGPNGLAIDKDGNVFVSNPDNAQNHGRLQTFDLNGNFKSSFVIGPTAGGVIAWGANIALDKLGNIYVSCMDAQSVRVYNRAGTVLKEYSLSDLGITNNLPVLASPFRNAWPFGIGIDGLNNVYLAASLNYQFVGPGPGYIRTRVIKGTGGVSPSIKPFAGQSRQDTAAQVALEAYPDGAAGVIIANGEGQGQTGKFPDALAASSLAGLLDYPILLTAPGTLPSYTEAAVKKLKPSNIIILGDQNSITKAVETKLGSYGKVTRLKGSNRIETAVAIYNYGKDKNGGWGKTAIFADAGNFPDALAIAPYAANKRFPIFLVQGSELSKSVKDAFVKPNFLDAVIVGSNKSVSTGIEEQINQALGGSKTAVRLQGVNRYETASKIAAFSVINGLSYDNAGIATGENFPDALTGGPLLAKRGSVVLLATNSNAGVLDLLKGRVDVFKLHVFGGDSAVSKTVRQKAATNLGWDVNKIQ